MVSIIHEEYDPATISQRGSANVKPSLMFDFKHRVGNHAAKSGLVDITSSVNRLMLDDLERFGDDFKIDFKTVLPYGNGEISEALRLAFSKFINRYFHPSTPVESSQVLVTNGVTSLIELVPFTLCDVGEAIMYPTPAYGMFKHNIEARNRVEILEVPMNDDFDQFTDHNGDELVAKFDAVRRAAVARNIRVKVLLICNPHNPIGRCYSRSTLLKLAQYCSRHGIHLISDEIYGMSGFQETNSSYGGPLDKFTSVLTLGKEGRVIQSNIHVLYGASKDFGLGGLRLGFLITRNIELLEACRRLAMTASISVFSAIFFTRLLTNHVFLDQYFLKYQGRLKDSYERTTTSLRQNNIPFTRANAGLYIWVDLSNWLKAFPETLAVENSPEMQLSSWLMACGVFIQPGEAFRSPYHGRFRLVYTSEPENVAAGVQLLITALDKLSTHEKKIENVAEVALGSKIETVIHISQRSVIES